MTSADRAYNAELSSNDPAAFHTIYSVYLGRGNSVSIDSLQAGRSGDRIPVGARFSAPVQTGPGAHAASYTMGTGVFPGG